MPKRNVDPVSASMRHGQSERLPIVAVVGRPNVGKSTLFNRLCETRTALVHDEAGVTRDRRYGKAEYDGVVFQLIDTGGLEMADVAPSPQIQAQINRQVDVALGEADFLLLVVDAQAGLVPGDQTIAAQLRRQKKPVFVVVNKVDHSGREAFAHEFHALGFPHIVGISAAHGRGIPDLLEALVQAWRVHPASQAVSLADAAMPETPTGKTPIHVALIGRPNVGKSSLVNALLGEDRMIVDDQPGTTHDAIDIAFEHRGQPFVLVDTAGMRRKARVHESIEKLSGVMTQKAIERADVILLVMDASQGVTEQDAKLAGLVQDAGKALILVFNKQDLVDKKRQKQLEDERDRHLQFIPWATHVFCSTKRAKTLGPLLNTIRRVFETYSKRVTTGELNRFFEGIVERHPPPLHKGFPIRLYYITQAQTRPPTFILSVNYPEGMHFSYHRYLQNEIRKTFGFEGSPLRIVAKKRQGQG